MGSKSSIEWTDASWTPVRARNRATGKVGWHCEHASDGCRFCYSETLNRVYGTKLPYKPGHRKDVELFLDDRMLQAPLRWRKPRMVFVCSMTDLFADFVPDEWVDQIFAIMALCPQHTFQVLTKRASRMRAYVGSGHGPRPLRVDEAALRILALPADGTEVVVKWPLPNVWLGCSAEDQVNYDERRVHLEDTAAAVRFWSLEPLLGPIKLGDLNRVSWAIVGGESGPSARPFPVSAARDIITACKVAEVPVFMKQFGAKPVYGTEPTRLKHGKGADMAEWPVDMQVRQMPEAA